MLFLHNISFGFPAGNLLFNSINLKIPSHSKSALVGSNGMGKSTLLKIIANEIQPLSGDMNVSGDIFYVPQMFGNCNHLAIAECLKIDQKLYALQKITNGEIDEIYFEILNFSLNDFREIFDSEINIRKSNNQTLKYQNQKYVN